jgi:hypothetical protein
MSLKKYLRKNWTKINFVDKAKVWVKRIGILSCKSNSNKKMIPSANNVNNSNKINLEIFSEDECDENLIKCQCTSLNIHRKHQTYRGGSMSSLIIYIYMWITIFAICCSGLPPVIKIGEYYKHVLVWFIK